MPRASGEGGLFGACPGIHAHRIVSQIDGCVVSGLGEGVGEIVGVRERGVWVDWVAEDCGWGGFAFGPTADVARFEALELSWVAG